MSTLSPAARYLLSALRRPQSPSALSAADWNETVAIAHAHGLAPLLFVALKPVASRAELAPLEEEYLLTLARNSTLLARFACLADDFDAAQIQVVALKGLAAIATLYDSPAERPTHDLDLLLHQEDLDSAGKKLLHLGYSPGAEPRPGFALEYEIERVYQARLPFPYQVELHWHLFRPRYARQHSSIAWFWNHLEPALVGGQWAQVLQPAAQVLHLAGHYALLHQGTRWLWLHDLVRLVERRGKALDWLEIAFQAETFGLGCALRYTLESADRLFGLGLAPEVWERLRRIRVHPLERLEFAFARSPQREARTVADGFIEALTERRIGLWRGLVLPSRGYLAARYGDAAAAQPWRLYLYRMSQAISRTPRHIWSALFPRP